MQEEIDVTEEIKQLEDKIRESMGEIPTWIPTKKFKNINSYINQRIAQNNKKLKNRKRRKLFKK